MPWRALGTRCSRVRAKCTRHWAAQCSAPCGATPGAALHLAPDRLGEAYLGVADHELNATQAALFERDLELAPETFALAVADLETQQLTAAVSIDPHCDDDGPGANLQGPWRKAATPTSTSMPPISMAAWARPVEERLHLHVDLSADAADLGSGDAALNTQGCHQGIDLAGGNAADVRLRDDAIEGLIDAAAGLEDRGQVAARVQLGDHQVDVADLGGQVSWPVAVAVAEPIVTALMALGTEYGRNLQLDQLLQAVADDLRDQLTGCAAIQ